VVKTTNLLYIILKIWKEETGNSSMSGRIKQRNKRVDTYKRIKGRLLMMGDGLFIRQPTLLETSVIVMDIAMK
jgi:hypothetical protein